MPRSEREFQCPLGEPVFDLREAPKVHVQEWAEYSHVKGLYITWRACMTVLGREREIQSWDSPKGGQVGFNEGAK